MVYRLFAKLTSLGMIALLLTCEVARCLAAEEYVFTAPPETGQKAEDIPASDTEYPMYECNLESDAESESDTNSETALDPHDCTCTDCEDLPSETKSERESTPQSNSGEP